jgi:hypothetical protein
MFSYQLLKCKGFRFIRDEPETLNDYNLIIDDLHPISEISEISSDSLIKIFINTTSKEFDDIHILTSEDNKFEASDKIQKDIQKPLMGASDNLEAIKTNQYSITRGKKNANIQNLHLFQNHEVIDSLAVNGVMMGPKTELNSIKTLFNKISKFNSFELTLYNPNLLVEEIESPSPTLFSVPVVVSGKGDILNIFYRYICLYFYSYMSIKDMFDSDSKYEI